ncbi:ABC transporter permease [Conexibacter sp. CPCC 206217]|uniref:ABC transporter permease n=1 Tax=Conexibacter sp. CPCC 206217 TaxID=3064574 RepID=UPI002721DC90|nr:ABC transporter permease [Conexibacter sp. CPCC 206217]MDO8210226.1 ABC transporter permease [Conexibacter sp. CPCC 206217]
MESDVQVRQRELPAPPPAAHPLKRAATRVLGGTFGPIVGVGGVLVALVLFELLTEPTFGSADNLTSLGRAAAVPLVVSAAMALVLLTGGVDLSIGSTLALTGVLYAKLVTGGAPAGLALIACLVFGAVVGFTVNGILIGRLDMSFFVVTIGTMSLYRGIVYLWTDSSTIDMYGDRVSRALGNDTILGGHVPIGLLVGLALVLALWWVLRWTTFGRSIYAVGGNREATELAGVRAGWVTAAVYGVSGLCAALAAVMTIGRSTIADPNMGLNLELTAAAAALLGGVALSGGVGSVWGAVLGVAFLQALTNALSLAGVSTSWQLIVTGAILIIAVYLDRVRARAGVAGG